MSPAALTPAVQPAAPAPDAETPARPPLALALRRGFACRCPACGRGRLFAGYLRPVTECESCAAPLGAIRADDAPPYFTIFAVGHVVVPLMLLLERQAAPPLWLHAAIWLPLTVGLSLALIRPFKGATIGAMLAAGIRGDEQKPELLP